MDTTESTLESLYSQRSSGDLSRQRSFEARIYFPDDNSEGASLELLVGLSNSRHQTLQQGVRARIYLPENNFEEAGLESLVSHSRSSHLTRRRGVRARIYLPAKDSDGASRTSLVSQSTSAVQESRGYVVARIVISDREFPGRNHASLISDSPSVYEQAGQPRSALDLSAFNQIGASCASSFGERTSVDERTRQALQALDLSAGISTVPKIVDDTGRDVLGETTISSGITTLEEESCASSGCRGRSSALPLEKMLKINELRKMYKHFTYYLLRSTKLVIHAEDGQNYSDLDRLKKDISQILAECVPPGGIIAISESFKASLCGNGIGEVVIVGSHCQTVGLYLKYRGKAYFATAGHLLATSAPAASATSAAADRADTNVVQMFPNSDHFGVVSSPETESVAAVFPCFSFNPLPNTTGEILMNHIDIMICEMPPLIDDCTLPRSRNEVRDRCKICFRHNCRHERDTVYTVKNIMHFNDKEDATQSGYPTKFVLHSAEHIVEKQLMCYPCRQEFVVSEVIGYKCEIAIEDNDAKSYFHNVLLMKPLGRAVPARGDCGSVWVTKDTGEAVAITCGMGEVVDDDQRISVWLAALLHPCLDAICAQHPSRFKSPTVFQVIA